MKYIDFEKAYLKIVSASKEQNSVEIPKIISCVDFSGKKCLEIGCGVLARLAVKICENTDVKSIICLDNYHEIIEKAKKVIKEKGLKNKIKIQYLIKSKDELYKLPFKDGSFDVVYGAWLPHELTTNENFLNEISRVSRKYILLLMPGINDDIVKMKSIVFPGEKEKRETYKIEIKCYLEDKGFNISFKEANLKLDFDSFEDIKGVFYCFDFKNQEIENEAIRIKVDDFIRERVHNIKNSFYCIIGEKL